ncbi:hypothetical protein [Candidatus Palauibacter sp.]|uniref:hypothetical protein n=1 Tax=Candidatus Palauibacter sp. TaxID=3101350 RepID=UPI003B01C329
MSRATTSYVPGGSDSIVQRPSTSLRVPVLSAVIEICARLRGRAVSSSTMRPENAADLPARLGGHRRRGRQEKERGERARARAEPPPPRTSLLS